MDKNVMIEGMAEGSSSAMASIGTIFGPMNINLSGFATVLGNTTSHWDLGIYRSPAELVFPPASEDDLIQRLIHMLSVARRDLEILQKSDPAQLPDSFTLLPLDSRRIRVKIRKTATPQFKFIEE